MDNGVPYLLQIRHKGQKLSQSTLNTPIGEVDRIEGAEG